MKSTKFKYEKICYEDESKIFFQDIMKAEYLTFAEGTLDWIFDLTAEINFDAKKLVLKLARAGIVEYSYNKFFRGSDALGHFMKYGSIQDICYYITFIGLKPWSLSYRDIGGRKDLSFEEKKQMFEMLYERMNVKIPMNTITDCYHFGTNKNIEEVKYFIIWCLEKGCEVTQCDFNNSFTSFGTDLFDFLSDHGIKPCDINHLLFPESKTLDEKIQAINYVIKKFPCIRHGFSEFLLQDELSREGLAEKERLQIIKYLISIGVSVNNTFLRFLLLSGYESHGMKFSFEFVTECIDYILNYTDVEIPYTGDDYYPFHKRECYRFGGELYDWMKKNQKKMQQSLQKRQEHEENTQIKKKEFVKVFGMSEDMHKKKQENAKKNGLCKFFY